MGDLLPLAYPEMVKVIFPGTFNANASSFRADVQVQLKLKGFKKGECRVYGTIAALISRNKSRVLRAGSLLFSRRQGVDEPVVYSSQEGVLEVPLARSAVVVPSGWALHIEVDLQIATTSNNSEAKQDLKYTTCSISNRYETRWNPGAGDNEVKVSITSWVPEVTNEDIGRQLSSPVEVRREPGYPTTVVYTIGDEMSFTEFIMTLRRILADHPGREDILDRHHLLNLSSTRQHPLLPEQHSSPPDSCWIQVKLQAVVEREGIAWTRLFIRRDNVYVHGFMNQQGDSYELLLNNKCRRMIPKQYNAHPLFWDVKYRTILDVWRNDDVVRKLEDAELGRDFVKKAVRVLSRFAPDGDNTNARLALAGLIVMVCESVRMNPLHDSFAAGWRKGTGFTEHLMRTYVWGYYGKKSGELRAWKSTRYAEPELLPYPIKDLQTIYLVLNTIVHQAQKEETKARHSSDGVGPSDDHSTKPKNQDYSRNQPQDKKTNDTARRHDNNHNNSGGSGTQRKRAHNQHSSDDVPQSSGGGSPAASQPGEAGDADSGGDSPGQLWGAGDAGSFGGSANQPEGNGDAGGNRGSQPKEADGIQDQGRPRVELLALAMRADRRVIGTTIIVFDGKRGQIIYEEEQGQQNKEEMVDLVLSGPFTGISAYGCFAIKIEIPANPPIEWEWNCYDPEYAAQVDKPPVRRHPIGNNVAEVTYAVMSNAREAAMQVMLRLKDDPHPSGIGGKITALIHGFEIPSVLFASTEVTDRCLCSTIDDSWSVLQLARNVVAVPCGEVLHIEMDLQVQTSNSQETKRLKANLDFHDKGIRTQPYTNDEGDEVKVDITWYPEIEEPECLPVEIERTSQQQEQTSCEVTDDVTATESGRLEVKMMSGHPPDVVYTIGDEESFTRFITDLRGFLTEHPDKEDILGRPVLAKQRAEQPARWLHVKLQVVEGKKTYSTTLLVRDDNLYVHGFTNQHGVVYEILDNAESENMVPNNPQRLYWGLNYNTILDVQDGNEATAKLAAEGLGKSFATKAVQRLSSSIHPDDQVPGMMSARVALACLIVMACESARMNPPRDAIAGGWSNDTVVFTQQLMDDCVRKYGLMSRKLQAWNRRNLDEPHRIAELYATYLVLNTRLPDTAGDGRPRVELLSIRADLRVIGTKIIVFDGKRGQIIYTHKEQVEQQGLANLVLTGPSTAISAYGCFAIKIDIPATDPVRWEWDCYDPHYAAQVDKPAKRQRIGYIAEVTYAVMSNALEATVQVKLRLNDGQSPVSIQGKITALIRSIGVWKVLLDNAQGMCQCFSPTDDSWFLLQLSRSLVMVPCDEELHIKVDLEIGTSNDQGMKHLEADFCIVNRILSQCHVVDGGQAEVSIIWYPPPPVPEKSFLKLPYLRELVYTIGDDGMSYTGFIMALRRILADHPDRKGEDILDGHKDQNLSSTGQHPVLTRLKNYMYFRIKLQVAGTGEFIVLAIDMDDLRVLGFENQEHHSYSPESGSMGMYGVCRENLRWGNWYDDKILPILMEKPERMGKNFAANAVRVLSRFSKSTQYKPEVAGSSGSSAGGGEEYDAKLALAGLRVMVCGSACINTVHDAIAAGWNDGTVLTEEMVGCVRNWERISSALQDWKEDGCRTWKKDERLEGIGIKNHEDALRVIRLCSAERMQRY